MYRGRLYYRLIFLRTVKGALQNITYKKAALALTELNQYIKLYHLSLEILQVSPFSFNLAITLLTDKPTQNTKVVMPL